MHEMREEREERGFSFDQDPLFVFSFSSSPRILGVMKRKEGSAWDGEERERGRGRKERVM